MKAFKGFNKNITCRGFQYKVGETYEEERQSFAGAATAGFAVAATAGEYGAATADE